MFFVRLSEDVAAFFTNSVGLSGVQALGRDIPDAGVFVSVVVPVEEAAQIPLSILDAAEGFRERVVILQRFELGFGIRVIVGGVGPRMCFGYTQVSHQLGDEL